MTSLFLVSPASARLAKPADLPSTWEFDHFDFEVDSTGRHKMVREFMIQIRNDDGREKQSLQTIAFNGRAEKFKVLDAYTVNAGKIQKVDLKKNLEFKEVGDFGRFFDRLKQAAITYPNVQTGSKIYLKYEIVKSEVAFERFWSMASMLSGDWIESFRIRVRAPMPLHTWVNDPENRLEAATSKKNGVHFAEIKTKSPLNAVTVNEENPYLRPSRTPYFSISTLKSWDKFGADRIPTHEKLLAKPLTPALEKIRKAAAEEKTPLDQLQRVSAMLSQEFRYFGDWRRRNGGYIPRSLAEIEETRYGDCKDLSLASTAIYRALGFKAHMAWVWRGVSPVLQEAYDVMPVESYFNHAITRVEADGQVYWIDATNPVSFARGTFADIGGRPAFVLNPKSPGLDRIPPVRPESGLARAELVYDLRPDGPVKVGGKVELKGRNAIGMTIESFYATPETTNYNLIRSLSAQGKVLDYSVGDYPRGSRIVNDITIQVQFTLADIGLRTSAGLGFPLMRDDVINSLTTDIKDRVSDIYLDIPNRGQSSTEIIGVQRVGNSSLDCQIDSEWASLSRKVFDTANGVSIEDQIEVRKQVIPVEAYAMGEFASFQKQVRDCFYRAAVILKPR